MYTYKVQITFNQSLQKKAFSSIFRRPSNLKWPTLFDQKKNVCSLKASMFWLQTDQNHFVISQNCRVRSQFHKNKVGTVCLAQVFENQPIRYYHSNKALRSFSTREKPGSRTSNIILFILYSENPRKSLSFPKLTSYACKASQRFPVSERFTAVKNFCALLTTLNMKTLSALATILQLRSETPRIVCEYAGRYMMTVAKNTNSNVFHFFKTGTDKNYMINRIDFDRGPGSESLNCIFSQPARANQTCCGLQLDCFTCLEVSKLKTRIQCLCPSLIRWNALLDQTTTKNALSMSENGFSALNAALHLCCFSLCALVLMQNRLVNKSAKRLS